jgi:hypothetical protein
VSLFPYLSFSLWISFALSLHVSLFHLSVFLSVYFFFLSISRSVYILFSFSQCISLVFFLSMYLNLPFFLSLSFSPSFCYLFLRFIECFFLSCSLSHKQPSAAAALSSWKKQQSAREVSRLSSVDVFAVSEWVGLAFRRLVFHCRLTVCGNLVSKASAKARFPSPAQSCTYIGMYVCAPILDWLKSSCKHTYVRTHQ